MGSGTPGVYYHRASVVINSSLEIIVHSEDVFVQGNDIESTTQVGTNHDIALTTHVETNSANDSTSACATHATFRSADGGVLLKAYQLGLLGLMMISLLTCSILALGAAIFQNHRGNDFGEVYYCISLSQ
jgi:hypothetical protein